MKFNSPKAQSTRVHLAPSLDYGGLETQLTTLGVEYSKTGRVRSVEFWSLRTGGIAEEKLKELGFVVKVLNSKFRTINLGLIFTLVRNFRASGVKEVFTHGFESNLNGIIAARMAGIRCVVAEEIGIAKHKHLLHLAFKFNYRLVMNLTVQSQQMKKVIEDSCEISHKKIVVIYPPVEISSIPQQRIKEPTAPIKLVFLGRLEKVKNLNLMFESLYILRNHYQINNWILNIYGGGTEEEVLQELIRQLDLQAHIYFKGKTKNIAEVIFEADWLLLSSESEGFGTVVVESMLYGVPVVTTNVGMAREIIISGQNSYVSKDHSVESYSLSLMNALTLNSVDYWNISKAAYNASNGKFSAKVYLEELDRLVENAN